MVSTAPSAVAGTGETSSTLHRVIGWKDAFWVASGVPALVLFSIGGIAATVGTPSVLVSIFRHFIQDKGVFPPQMLADLSVDGTSIGRPKAGMLPYVALAGGVLSATVAYVIFWT